MGHDVAPVTGRIADRQQDRLGFGLGERKRFVIPGMPVDRVLGMLLEVGAGFEREAISHIA